MERAGWGQERGHRARGGSFIQALWLGLGVQQLRLWPLTQLVPSQGISFHICPALAFGVRVGGWSGLTLGWASLCLGGEWSLRPRPRCPPGLLRHSLPPAPQASSSLQGFLREIQAPATHPVPPVKEASEPERHSSLLFTESVTGPQCPHL